MSTSVSYLRKRLAAPGRHDLLSACEAGLVSTFACAEEAGLIKRRAVTGNGSENQAKKRAWALARITRGTRPLPPKPEPQAIAPKPEPQTTPPPTRIDAQPMFSQESRDILARLVQLNRADLVVLVAERKISPAAAGRIAERGDGQRRTTPTSGQKAKQAKPAKPEAKRPDVRALVG